MHQFLLQRPMHTALAVFGTEADAFVPNRVKQDQPDAYALTLGQ
jgi:hypothetical protein